MDLNLELLIVVVEVTCFGHLQVYEIAQFMLHERKTPKTSASGLMQQKRLRGFITSVLGLTTLVREKEYKTISIFR